METTYTWEDAPDGATKMTLRDRGEPSGFAAVTAPVMSRAMRRPTSDEPARVVVTASCVLLGVDADRLGPGEMQDGVTCLAPGS